MNWLVMDVGGSGVKYALADEAYRLSEAGVLPTRYDTHASFIDAVGGIYDGFAGTVAGIAVSTCGELDPDTGHMFSGGSLRFNSGTNLIDAITARCGVPVSIENDANCALLAEAHSGCLTDCRNAVALTIGTAVGGAVMINRALYRGSHFHAGNASFTKVALADGASPQLDSLNGVGALTARYAATVGLPAGAVDGPAFFALVHQGDPAALESLDSFCTSLGNYIFNVQTVLDVEAVAIGGGISAQPVFIDMLRQSTDRSFARATARIPKPDVRACHHFNNANLLGALRHHRAGRGH